MRPLRSIAQDALFALRVMRKAPLATATIILCLGFSIGASATVIAWMEGIVLRPIRGVHDVGRLVSLKTTTQTGQGGFSYLMYKDLRDEQARAARPLVQLAAYSVRRFSLAMSPIEGQRQAEPVWGNLVSANYFDVLRVRPVLGRGFAPGEDSVAGREPVAVISHALWERRFASDPSVVNRRVWVNGVELTVIGVAPPAFVGTISGLAFDIWMPMTLRVSIAENDGTLQDRGIRWMSVFGRLPPGGSLESVRAAVLPIGARFAATYPEDKDYGLTARTLDIGPGERLEPLFAIMLAITTLVMLIVCTNVANLLLLRGASREHEIAVRLAMGAPPSRIVRQLMTESFMLAAAGVTVGVGVAVVAQRAFGAFMPESPLPVAVNTSLNLRIVFVLAALGVATVFVFGLAPALRTVRAAMRVSLTGGTRGATSSGAGVRGALVGAQFALSLAVLAAAGLFVRRLDELQQLDRGFREPDKVVVATVDFELSTTRGDSLIRQTVERIVERLNVLPGARSAAAATFVPLGFLGYRTVPVVVAGYAPQPGEGMAFLSNRVTPRYFETMGVPVVRGRAITDEDREGTLPVAVVNEAFGRFWGNRDPVGRRIDVGGRSLAIVGVVGNGKYNFLEPLDEPSKPFVYLPYAQWGGGIVVLHVRATGDPLTLMPAIRREVASVQPDLSVLSPLTLARYTDVPIMPMRLGASLLSVLGGAALLLAALGLYAVIAYSVTQRQREIGVRMALGATPRRMVTAFLLDAAKYTGLGAVGGFLLAFGGIRALDDYVPYILPQVAGARVMSVVLALLALTTVALFAALVPANRATRVDPTTALRAE